MHYYVTYDDPSAAAVILDGAPQQFELGDALAHACRLLDEKKQGVTIRGENNITISGDDLAACCNGDKVITPDLLAVSN